MEEYHQGVAVWRTNWICLIGVWLLIQVSGNNYRTTIWQPNATRINANLLSFWTNQQANIRNWWVMDGVLKVAENIIKIEKWKRMSENKSFTLRLQLLFRISSAKMSANGPLSTNKITLYLHKISIEKTDNSFENNRRGLLTSNVF